jgi:hypothetical protein
MSVTAPKEPASAACIDFSAHPGKAPSLRPRHIYTGTWYAFPDQLDRPAQKTRNPLRNPGNGKCGVLYFGSSATGCN